MSKKPVMTRVYGSTLLSTIDGLALELLSSGVEPIKNSEGKIAYSLSALATPVGKALRAGVRQTVPKSAEMMDYLQMITRRHKEQCMHWITPVGVPVVNWSEGHVIKKVFLRSMGVESILLRYNNGQYDVRSASNGIVPNFVHSLDSAHLCMTINDCDAQILPIHDSFATHPCDVQKMHESLRKTFADLYSQYSVQDFLSYNNIDTEEYPVPEQGSLDIQVVNSAPYMFC